MLPAFQSSVDLDTFFAKSLDRSDLEVLYSLEESPRSVSEEDFRRVARARVRASGPIRIALKRVEMAWKRNQVSWDVYSELRSTLEASSISRELDSVARNFREASASERISMIHRAVREERVGWAPVLSTRLLIEESPEVAKELAHCLGVLGGTSSLLALKRASRHTHEMVRFGAVQGLAFQQGFDTLRLLIERLRDESEWVADAAEEVLLSYPDSVLLNTIETLDQAGGKLLLRGCVRLSRKLSPSPRRDQFLLRWSESEDVKLRHMAWVQRALEQDPKVPDRVRQLVVDPDPAERAFASVLRRAVAEGKEAQSQTGELDLTLVSSHRR